MRKFRTKTTYLDYASATPLDTKTARLLYKVERTFFANPSSIHTHGVEARAMIEDARGRIARAIFAHPDEIIFTGSGTESDALAIIGTVRSCKGILPHIVTSSIEHPAVLEVCTMLEKNGEATVTYVNPDARGIVNPKNIRDALKENTVLVSIMYANNEIGTIQPIIEIAKEIRHFRKSKQFTKFPLFHTDACQAVNYLSIENIEKLGVDMLTCNSSKIYGPKGVGVLYKKRDVSLAPLYSGGGQEFGFRSGTENTIGIIGFAHAFEEVQKIKEKEVTRLTRIRDYGIERLLALSGTCGYEIYLNGDESNRLPNNINISVSGISSELLVIELDAKGIEVSSKSACKSDEPDESYVIQVLNKAQGIEKKSTDGSLRISLGRQTTKKDMDRLVEALSGILEKYSRWK